MNNTLNKLSLKASDILTIDRQEHTLGKSENDTPLSDGIYDAEKDISSRLHTQLVGLILQNSRIPTDENLAVFLQDHSISRRKRDAISSTLEPLPSNQTLPHHSEFIKNFLDTAGIVDTSIRKYFLDLASYLEGFDMEKILNISNGWDLFYALEYYLKSGLDRKNIIAWFADNWRQPDGGFSIQQGRMMDIVGTVYCAFHRHKHRNETAILAGLTLEQIRSKLRLQLLEELQILFEARKSEVIRILLSNGKILRQNAKDGKRDSAFLQFGFCTALTNAAGKTLEDLANDPTITSLQLLQESSFEERKNIMRAALRELHQDSDYPVGSVEHSMASTIILYYQKYGWLGPENLGDKKRLMEAFQRICSEFDRKKLDSEEISYDPRDYAALHLVYAMGVEEDLRRDIFEEKFAKASSIEEHIQAKVVTSEDWHTKVRTNFAQAIDAEYGFGIASKPSKEEFVVRILTRLSGWSEQAIRTLKRKNVPYTENGVRGIRKKHKDQTLLEEFLDRADNYYYEWPNPGYQYDPMRATPATMALPPVSADHSDASIVVRNWRAKQINAGMELKNEEENYNKALPAQLLGLARMNLWKAKKKWTQENVRLEINRLVGSHKVETQEEFERKKDRIELRRTLESILVPGLNKLDEAIVDFREGRVREGMLSLLEGYATFLGTLVLGETAGRIGRVGKVNSGPIAEASGDLQVSTRTRARTIIAENVLQGFNARPKHLINAVIEENFHNNSPSMEIPRNIIMQKAELFKSPIPEEFRNLAPHEVRQDAVHPTTKEKGQVAWVLDPHNGNNLKISFLRRFSPRSYSVLDWQTGNVNWKDGIVYQERKGLYIRGGLRGGGKVGQQLFESLQKKWLQTKRLIGKTTEIELPGERDTMAASGETAAGASWGVEKRPRPLTLAERAEVEIQQHEQNAAKLVNTANELFQTIESLQAERNASFEIEGKLRKVPSENPDAYVNTIIREAKNLMQRIEQDQAAGRLEETYAFQWSGDQIEGKAGDILPTLKSIIAIPKRGEIWRRITEQMAQAAQAMSEAKAQIGKATKLRTSEQAGTIFPAPPLPKESLYRPDILIYDGQTGSTRAIRDTETYSLEEIEQWVKVEYEKPFQDRDRDGLVHHGRLPNTRVSSLRTPSGEKIPIEQLKGEKFYWVSYLTSQGEIKTKVPLPVMPFESRGIIHYNPQYAEGAQVRFGKPNLKFVSRELTEGQQAAVGREAETHSLQAKLLEQRYNIVTGDFTADVVNPPEHHGRVTQWKPINNKLSDPQRIPSEPVQIRETTPTDSEGVQLYYFNSDGVLVTDGKWYKKADVILLYRQTLQERDRSLINNWNDSEEPKKVVLSLPHPDSALAGQQMEIAKFQASQGPKESLPGLLGVEEYEISYIDALSEQPPQERKIRLILPKLMTESHGIMKVMRWGDGHFEVQFGKPIFHAQNASGPIYIASRYLTKPGFLEGTRGGTGTALTWRTVEYPPQQLEGMVTDAYPELVETAPLLPESQTQEDMFRLSPVDSQMASETLTHKANSINEKLSFLITSEAKLMTQGIETGAAQIVGDNILLYPYVDEKIRLALQKEEHIRQAEASHPGGIYNLRDLDLPYIPEQVGHWNLSELSAEQAYTILSYYTDLEPGRRNQLALNVRDLRNLARDIRHPSRTISVIDRKRVFGILLQEAERLEKEAEEMQLEAARLKAKMSSMYWRLKELIADEQELATRTEDERKANLLPHEAGKFLSKVASLRRIALTFEENLHSNPT